MEYNNEEVLEFLTERVNYLEWKVKELENQVRKLSGRTPIGENTEIRQKMMEYGIPQWRLGEELCITENEVGRKLRKRLSNDVTIKMLGIIERIHENDIRKGMEQDGFKQEVQDDV